MLTRSRGRLAALVATGLLVISACGPNTAPSDTPGRAHRLANVNVELVASFAEAALAVAVAIASGQLPLG